MSVEIKEIKENDKKGKKQFVKFPNELYKNCPYYVPSLTFEELMTLDEKKNPAFEVCEKKMFLAYKNGQIAGRICAIINNKAIEEYGKKIGRFGFADFIDDSEVVDALFNAAESWLRQNGMEAVTGPEGFSGLDHQGLLIEGFEELTTMASKYNFPYYQNHFERIGLEKVIDAKEYKVKVPEEVPERHKRLAGIILKRNKLKVLHVKSKKEAIPYTQEIFKLLNEVYKDLHGFVPLTTKQIDYYVKLYVPLLQWDFVTIITKKDTNKIVGFGISMPFISKALIKSKGKLFPFGWFHLLKGIYGKKETVELLLIGIDKDYQGSGLNSIIFSELTANFIKHGIKYAETNPELEANAKANAMWGEYDHVQHKKRRFYKKDLN